MKSDMQRYVVGVDGSAAAAAAMQWAGQLATKTGAEIVAVHGFENPWAEVTPDDQARLIRERCEELAGPWVRSASDAGVPIRTSVLEGDPRNVVVAAAASEDASLVVLGRTGRGGGPGFLHLGSVVEHVAHHTRAPLAVVPSTGSTTVDRIVLGVDGSAESLAAVEWSAELAKACDATVVAVAVYEPYLEWTPSTSPKNWRREVEQKIATWVVPIAAEGITVDHLAQRDLHPADGLLGVASARGGDVLVIGTRGVGGFSGLRMGGVAMKVLHRTSLPLVLVPPSS